MNIHVIIGEDDYLVAETAKKFIGDGAGLEVIDSLNSTNAETQLHDLRLAEDSVSTPPFLDPKKVTWWKNVHFLPGAGGKKPVAEEVKAALEKFASRLAAAALPENQEFILSGPRLLKTSVFAKTLAAVAETVVFAPQKPWEAARSATVRLIVLAKDEGLSFAPGVAEKFVSIVGTDMRSLKSELGKMRDYLGPDEAVVTAAAVDEITSPGPFVEPEIWSVTDAIGRRDLGAALRAVAKFELENGFDVFMTGIIEKFFRQLIDVKNGRTDGMNPYALGKLRGFLANWPLNRLRLARARFLALRERAVSGAADCGVLVTTELAAAIGSRP